MVKYIQFQSKAIKDSVISGTDENRNMKSILGPVSTNIIECSSKGDIVLVFGQGNLQLTPLITSLFIESECKGDVIIGIPRNKYNELNTLYYKNFYSLIKGNDHFIYKDALWCSIRKKKDTSTDNSTIFELNDIQYRPKHGIKRYKDKIETSIKEELENSSINDKKFIVTFPLDIGLENLVLDNTELALDNINYPLRSIVPKLIILESVNNTMRNLDPIMPLINYLLENKTGAVIHFSWPYINGLSHLFQLINNFSPEKKEKLKIFHLGKRFSIDIKDYVIGDILKSTNEASISLAKKEHPAIEQLSIEGKNWNSYYPSIETVNSKNVVFCTPVNEVINGTNIDKSFREPTETDVRIEEFTKDLNEHRLPGNLWYLFKFMSFVDSFVPPDSLKYWNKSENGTYNKMGILYIISQIKKTIKEDDAYLLDSAAGIIKSMSETMDVLDYIKKLKTPQISTKYSIIISFVLKSILEFDYTNIILCDYNPKLGFKKYMHNYIYGVFDYIKKYSSKNSPFDYDRLPKNDFTLFSQSGDIIQSKLENNKIFKFNFTEKGPSEFIITVDLGKSSDSKHIKKKIIISLESMEHLTRNINYYDFENTTLLLPGPLPIIRFDGEIPTLSEGIDIFLRPFKKIIIFVNKGNNYLRTAKQIETIRDFLFGDKTNSIAEKDMQISYSLNNSLRDRLNLILKKHKIYEKLDIPELSDNAYKIQDTLDNTIREEYIENEKDVSQEEYKTLKDLWNTISAKKDYTQYEANKDKTVEFVDIRVKFEENNRKEIISFRKGTYIRLVDSEDDDLILVEDIKPGQRIAYIESDNKESLDNYLIKEYSNYTVITIEEIYEPFKCLSIFYTTLSNIKFSESYSESCFDQIYWLSKSEKYQLYNAIHFLMELDSKKITNVEYIREYFKNSVIWSSIAELDDECLNILKNDFILDDTINLRNLYSLALMFGLDYEYGSFNSLISTITSGKNKYFFLNENNLLAISYLINYNKITENYENLTDAGKNIQNLLQQIGKSLKRVISKNKKSLSEMDLLIEKKVMVCKVL